MDKTTQGISPVGEPDQRTPKVEQTLMRDSSKSDNEARIDGKAIPFARFGQVVDIASKIVTVLAVIVGGIWTYQTFIQERLADWSVELTLDTETVELSDGQVLLVVNTTLKNTGKVPAVAGSKGLTLSVFEHGDAKGEKTEGYENLLDWDGHGIKPLVYRFNMLSRYSNANTVGYKLNPGDLRQESEAVLVSRGRLYGVAVRFWGINEYDQSERHTLRSNASCKFTYIPKSSDLRSGGPDA
jgi:hypothetical protein